MNDKEINELIDKVLRQDMALPEGLSERLEQQIDAWSVKEKKEPVRSTFQRRSVYWFSGAAAIALLCVGLFQLERTRPYENRLADTYTNPKEAADAAQKALLFMSENLNKGMDQVDNARKEINKVNTIVNKHLNEQENEN